jgi:hypothetical protein
VRIRNLAPACERPTTAWTEQTTAAGRRLAGMKQPGVPVRVTVLPVLERVA